MSASVSACKCASRLPRNLMPNTTRNLVISFLSGSVIGVGLTLTILSLKSQTPTTRFKLRQTGIFRRSTKDQTSSTTSTGEWGASSVEYQRESSGPGLPTTPPESESTVSGQGLNPEPVQLPQQPSTLTWWSWFGFGGNRRADDDTRETSTNDQELFSLNVPKPKSMVN